MFILSPLVLALLSVSSAAAFFDEIVALKAELQVWEEAHAADFSDVVARLDDLTAPAFADVASNDWFNAYVSSLAEWGIVSGYKDASGNSTGEFRPANPVTIAEVLKMAMEAAKVEQGNCTSDPAHAEARGHWSQVYVVCGERMNMRLMSANAALELNRPAKRAEVVAIVHDAFGDEVLPVYSSFRDVAGHPFEADIATASLYGMVSGDKDGEGRQIGTFRPDASINRAEVTKIIYERIKREARETLATSM
jgi:hypothetical protein